MIRLQRVGRPKLPLFRVVAAEKSKAVNKAVLEVLGQYDPRQENPKEKLRINSERLSYWQSHGAKTSPGLQALLKHGERGGGGAGEKVEG